MELQNIDDFLTVKELSKWIKLSASHIYFLVNKKKIPFAKLGGKLLFDKNKIKNWIEENSSIEETFTPPLEEKIKVPKPEKIEKQKNGALKANPNTDKIKRFKDAMDSESDQDIKEKYRKKIEALENG